MAELGRAARGPGRVYLTGGGSALLQGWRQSTVDIDIRLDPEPLGAFEAIRDLKERLRVNVELASPQDFVPELPGWRARSSFVARFGLVDFFHYDFYAQALAKLERGHERDLGDVEEMVRRRLVLPERLLELLDAVAPDLLRYPSIDADRFVARVRVAVARWTANV